MTDRDLAISHAQAEWIKAITSQEKRLWGKALISAVLGESPAQVAMHERGARLLAESSVDSEHDSTTTVCEMEGVA